MEEADNWHLKDYSTRKNELIREIFLIWTAEQEGLFVILYSRYFLVTAQAIPLNNDETHTEISFTPN